jgi:uncharacterized protein (TIGR02391 family)
LAGFAQELRIAAAAGLLTFRSDRDEQPNLAENNPNYYLQTIWNFALSVEGQDRARGRVIVQPLPDPDDDDGRLLSDLTLRRIAAGLDEEYAPDQVSELLSDEEIPPAYFAVPEVQPHGPTHAILATLWRSGSDGRRRVRRFVGRWLDDRLLAGPDVELRARLIDQLARQGWRVRAEDACLVIAEPVRGVPVGASFLRASRLHPLIESEARDQFLLNKPGQGVFASMKAVEIRTRKLAGFSGSVIGVDLMNRAFGPGGPLVDPSTGKGEQDGTRAFFAGAYALLRNPAGHQQVDYQDISEAAEAVLTASLLMRLLDRVGERLVANGRASAGAGAGTS